MSASFETPVVALHDEPYKLNVEHRHLRWDRFILALSCPGHPRSPISMVRAMSSVTVFRPIVMGDHLQLHSFSLSDGS